MYTRFHLVNIVFYLQFTKPWFGELNAFSDAHASTTDIDGIVKIMFLVASIDNKCDPNMRLYSVLISMMFFSSHLIEYH